MTERIQSISLGLGASIVLPVVAMTGITGRIRSPFPDAAAEIKPNDGSIFTAEVTEEGIRLIGLSEGEGEITLIAGPNPSQRTTYRVIVEAINDTTRWVFGFGGVVTEGTILYPAMDLAVDASADPDMVVTWSGPGADLDVAVDWGDGTTETIPAGQGGANHVYTSNGTYTFTADPVSPDPDVSYQTATTMVTVAGGPEDIVFNVDLAADPLAAIVMSVGVNPIKVDWGDGHVDTDIAPDQASHMYAQNGQYTITVSTSVPGYAPGTSDISINNADLGGASAPPPDTICYGPFNIPGLQQFWVCTAPSIPDWFSVAIDIYGEPGPDLQVFGAQLASALDDFPQEQVAVAIAKVREVWGR